jgi:hypothetical protein
VPPTETLPIPLDIPWKLAATTQQRETDPYDEFLDASISLFYYEPKSESLAADYPTERVIYFKAIVSLYPAKMPKEFGPLWIDPPIYVSDYLDGLSGVWHALLDFKVTPDSHSTDLMRPYFHAAAPTSREMIQTGVIGTDQAEGSSNSVSVGKSATTLHETIYSSAMSKSEGGAIDLKALSYGKGSSATDVFTERTLNERIDSTTRDASQERRELLSHHTDISNILSLLSAYHIGSPYVRLSMWPRPISLLSLDASDPNLWYMELLRRRSSGLEGTQEVFLVLVVPKNEHFCIEAQLKRFFVADKLPMPPKLDEGFGQFFAGPGYVEAAVVLQYLYGRFPRGTPLESLDVDLKPDPKVFPSPAVDSWLFNMYTEYVVVFFVSAPPNGNLTTAPTANRKEGYAAYKSFEELFLEATIAQYEAELATSPLERGTVVMMPKVLTTCYALDADAPVTVKSSKVYTPTPSVAPPPASVGGGADGGATYYAELVLAKSQPSPSKHARALVARWNQLERAYSRQLEVTSDWSAASLDLSHARNFDLFLSAAANLAPSDARNVPVDDLIRRLPLSKDVRDKVSRAGLTTLRDLARYLRAAPTLERIAGTDSSATPPQRPRGRAQPSPGRTQFAPLLDRETRVSIADAMREAGSRKESR